MPSKETVLGRVQQKDQGEYNESKEYILLDRVTYNDTIYECIKQATNILPTNTANWITVAHMGKLGRNPNYKWNGTKLSVENEDETYDTDVDLQGPKGTGSTITISDSIDSTDSTVGASSKAVSTLANTGPVGFIAMFYGTFGGTDNRYPIPPGGTEPDTKWVICDGIETNGIQVPDLRGKFLVQTNDAIVASSYYDILGDDDYDEEEGYITLSDSIYPSRVTITKTSVSFKFVSTGNAISNNIHSHNYEDLSVTTTLLGIAPHEHTIDAQIDTKNFMCDGRNWGVQLYFSELSDKIDTWVNNDCLSDYTSPKIAHTHTLTGTCTVTNNNSDLPPYIVLAYIMKIA